MNKPELDLSERPIELSSPVDTVSLRQLTVGDVSSLFSLLTSNREHLRRFLPLYEDNLHSEDLVKKFLELDKLFPNRYRFGIRDGEVLVGMHTLYTRKNTGEITTWVGAEFSGNNYAVRGGNLILDFAFNTLGLTKLISHIDRRNKAALKAISGSSFQKGRTLSVLEFPLQHFTFPNPNLTP